MIIYWSPVRIREGGHAAALAQWQSSRLTASPKFKKSLSGEAPSAEGWEYIIMD